ncbi:unnamed protein product [Diamesa tonsa]
MLKTLGIVVLCVQLIAGLKESELLELKNKCLRDKEFLDGVEICSIKDNVAVFQAPGFRCITILPQNQGGDKSNLTIKVSEPHQLFYIDQVLLHEDYKYALEHNVALLRVESYIEFNDYVAPICLPTSERQLGEFGNLVGFGKISSDSDPKSKFLAVAEYSVTESSNCLDNKLSDFNTTKYFCAENNSGNIRISDLGSGLYFNKTNTWFIGGIVSRPSTIPCDNNYILFTNIQPYIPWIQSTSTKSN